MSPKPYVKLIALALAVTALLVPSAGATTAGVQDLQPLSAGPLPGCNVPLDIEMDTRIAVNPTDAKNLVASWFELGVLTPVALGSTVVGVSHDGGATWKQVVVPGHSGCSGSDEPDATAADPAVAFDRNGVVYVGSLNHSWQHESVLVSRSTDGGDTWEKPELVDRYDVAPDNVLNAFYVPPDSPGENALVNHELWLETDPSHAGSVYAVWSKRDSRPKGNRYWPAYISRRTQTSDGRGSWSTAQIFYDPAQKILPFGHMLRVLPDGRLLDAFWECDAARPRDPETEKDPNRLCRYSGRGQVLALASADGGSHWSRAVIADGTDACGEQPKDPATGFEVFAQPKPTLDVAPDGTAYATWHAIRCNGEPSRILLSTSTDGGVSWSAPTPIPTTTAQAFYPTLAVGVTGVIGVTYYDLRNDRPDDDEATTDVWFAHSHDRGKSWEEAHLAGPFDVSKPGAFLADYYGLAALPRGFAASFVQPPPAAPEPPQDIFFARLFVPGDGAAKKATGGGWLADSDGRKINFGFQARETAFGSEGDLQLNDRAYGAKVHLSELPFVGGVGGRCGSIHASASSLELRGTGTYNETAASFRVCVQDNGEGTGAQADRFFLACTAGCGYSTGARAPDDAIDGGNIRVSGADATSDRCGPTLILDPLLTSEARGGLTLRVRVYDENQEPDPNAGVTLSATTSAGVARTLTAVSDADGTASFPDATLAVAAEYRAAAGCAESNTIELSTVLP